jgi:hypothetical protein
MAQGDFRNGEQTKGKVPQKAIAINKQIEERYKREKENHN